MDEWRYTIYNFTPVITTCLPSIITFAMPHQAGVLYVGIFYKLRSKLPKRVLKNIYFAFVHPHILYGVEIYANTSRTHIDRLMKLNNTLLRILQNQPRQYHVTELYVNYNTLSVTDLYIQRILLLVHNFVYHKDKLPEIFNNYFMFNNEIHNYNTREILLAD